MTPSVLSDIDRVWSQVRRPVGFVADVSSESELTHELQDVEGYFQGKEHTKVLVSAREIGYMCALPWMRIEAAVYYAQCYLRFIVNEPCSDAAVVDYIESALREVEPSMTDEQREVCGRAIAYFQSHREGEI